MELRAGASDYDQRTRHGIDGIGRLPTGYVNAWEQAPARGAETERHIAVLIHRDATQPEVNVRVIERLLLVNKRNGARAANLVPAHRCQRPSSDRMIHNQRFMVTKVSVGQAEHHAIAEPVELLAGWWLGNARQCDGAGANLAICRHRHLSSAEDRIPRICEINVKLEQVHVRSICQTNKVVRRAAWG